MESIPVKPHPTPPSFIDADRAFAMTVRAALIMLVRALEKRYHLKEYSFDGK